LLKSGDDTPTVKGNEIGMTVAAQLRRKRTFYGNEINMVLIPKSMRRRTNCGRERAGMRPTGLSLLNSGVDAPPAVDKEEGQK